MKLRCSRLPLFFDCPSSISDWAHPIESGGDAANLGTVVHAALAAMVRGEEPELELVARPYGIDVAEVERLFAYGKKAWKELAPSVHEPVVEKQFDGGFLTGACDVVSTSGQLVVVDWKSGSIYRNHREQLRGYAHLAYNGQDFPVKAVIVWLQLGFFEVFDFTERDIFDLERDIETAACGIGKKYSPSADCAFCRGRAECKAKANYERMASEAISVMEPQALTSEKLVALYPQAKLLESALKAYDEMLHAALVAGPLQLPDGRQIELKKVIKQEILAKEAWPIMAEVLDEEEMAAVCSITKGKLMDAVAAKAAKNCKGKDQMRMLGNLKDAGAINETSFVKIQVTKAKQVDPKSDNS